MKGNFIAQNKTFCLMTDRLWDFQALRALYSKNACSVRPSHWNRVFNLRVEFTRKYGATIRPENSRDMLNFLRLDSKLGSLSALDECVGLASVVMRMARDGYTFLNPELITEKSRVPQTLWEMSNTVLRLAGLSWDVRVSDVLDFFSGIPLPPESVVLMLNRAGRATGWALVAFSSSSDASLAMARHGGILGRQSLRLSFACRSDFDRAVQRQRSIRHAVIIPLSDKIPRSDTPIQANQQLERTEQSFVETNSRWSGAIKTQYHPISVDFLEASSATGPRDATALHSSANQPGLSFLGNSSNQMQTDDSNPSLNQSHSSTTSYAVLSQSSSSHSSSPGHHKTTKAALMELCAKYAAGTVVSIHGLPFAATDAQVHEFFSAFDYIPQSVVITYTEEGRPSGDAFVAFTSAEMAKRAVAKGHNQFIGSRYVELSIVN